MDGVAPSPSPARKRSQRIASSSKKNSNFATRFFDEDKENIPPGASIHVNKGDSSTRVRRSLFNAGRNIQRESSVLSELSREKMTESEQESETDQEIDVGMPEVTYAVPLPPIRKSKRTRQTPAKISEQESLIEQPKRPSPRRTAVKARQDIISTLNYLAPSSERQLRQTTEKPMGNAPLAGSRGATPRPNISRRGSRLPPPTVTISPIEKRMAALAVKTPSKARKTKKGSDQEEESPKKKLRLTPARQQMQTAESKTKRAGAKGQEILADVASPANIPQSERLKIRLKKTGSNCYRLRTGLTPKTPAKPASEDETSDEESSEEVSESSEEEMEEGDSESENSSEGEAECFMEEEAWKGATKQRKVRRIVMEKSASPRKPNKKAKNVPANSLEGALLRLGSSEQRGSLLCREEECAQIKEFIKYACSPRGISSAMYVSGFPGTGKTASVLAMVSWMTEAKRAPFIFIHVNAMFHQDPRQVFADIHREFTRQYSSEQRVQGKKRPLAPSTARRRLNSIFEMADSSRPPVLLLLDELDQMCTKRQELLYDIFNWTSIAEARINVIAIANTLDLPERMLSQRISSRLGLSRLIFQPYEHPQIVQIVEKLLGELASLQVKDPKSGEEKELVDRDCLQFAARKVASISGDLRKALDTLRSAIRLAINRGDHTLTMQHVIDAMQKASSTLLVHAVESLSTHQLALFEAVVDIARHRDSCELSFNELLIHYTQIVSSVGGAYETTRPLNDEQLLQLVKAITTMRLVVWVNPSERPLRRRLRLLPDPQDALSAIKMSNDRRKTREEEDVKNNQEEVQRLFRIDITFQQRYR